MTKRIYRAAVSQRLRNTGLDAKKSSLVAKAWVLRKQKMGTTFIKTEHKVGD